MKQRAHRLLQMIGTRQIPRFGFEGQGSRSGSWVDTRRGDDDAVGLQTARFEPELAILDDAANRKVQPGEVGLLLRDAGQREPAASERRVVQWKRDIHVSRGPGSQTARCQHSPMR